MIVAPSTPLPGFPKPRQAPSGEPVLSIPGYRLRPCRDADLPFLKRLYRHARDAELARTGWPEEMKRAFCEQQFHAQHTDYLRRFPDADFLLILDRRDPVGRLYVDRGLDLHLVDISLLPQRRGRGLGTAVLRALRALAMERGGGVVLSVAVDNPRAAALYHRMGFRHRATDDTRHHLRWDPDPSATE
ncbi:GNAT family N-acetyltransferase [Azospirillum halopraeferens]|uniref:GNAT family N-acetyltransferase n=1 Tax=Azospirillum halopraeferens TaxID=34010 RepID=UPI0003FF3B70|nr:N-acetyltransferase [Azospirillum halopraeferens]